MVWPNRPIRLLACAVLAALLYFPGLGRPALWEPDEGRYAEIAREMLISGDYLTPRNDWVRYFEKPPLVYWAGAGAIAIFGRNEFAVRFQAAAASVGTVVITMMLGEAMFDVSVGVLSAIAIALSPLVFVFARFATPDPALAFFLTAGLTAFYCAARSGNFRAGRGRRLMLAASAMLALGTLVKGPIALLLGGGVALIWLLVERRSTTITTIRWPECIGLYLAISLPWFIVVALRNPGFTQFYLVHEHLQRFLVSEEHGWGPWFFFPVVILGMWPFVYFAPLGTFESWRGGVNRGATHFLLIWFAIVFVFFSIPRSKLGEYILPALPPLAILAARGLLALTSIERARARRVLGWFTLIALAAMFVGLPIVALAMLGDTFDLATKIASDTVCLCAAVLLILQAVVAATAYLMARFSKWRWPSAAMICAVALATVPLISLARNKATALASYRGLATVITPTLERNCVLASYHHFVQALPFYTQTRERLVGYQGELGPFGARPDGIPTFIPTDLKLASLWASSSCVVLVANRTDLARLEALLSPQPITIACEGKKVALTNRPESTAGGAKCDPPDAMNR